MHRYRTLKYLPTSKPLYAHSVSARTNSEMSSKLLNFGSYGKVYRDGALDTVRKEYETDYIDTDGVPRDALREVSALITMQDHDNIVKFKGASYKAFPPRATCVLEFAPMKSLRDELVKHQLIKGAADPWYLHTKKSLILDMWRGIAHMHSCGITHRDIKPENMLLFPSADPAGVRLKIADFGTAVIQARVADTLRTDPVSTLWYRPPEIALKMRNMHGPAVDVWAGGLVMTEIMTECATLFGQCVDNPGLFKAMCYKFGTPTKENGLMPSYFKDHMYLPCDVYPIAPIVETIYGFMVPQEPYYSMTKMALTLEPASRTTSEWMKNCAEAGKAVYPEELSVPWERTRQCALRRMQKVPRSVLEDQNTRFNMGMCLHSMCARFTRNDSRRTFHVAMAALDMLVANKDFVDRKISDHPKDWVLVCMGIACVASKLCEPEYASPYYIKDANYYGRYFADKAVRYTTKDVAAMEEAVVSACGWDFWTVTPMEVASDMTSNTHRERFVRDYAVDTICCCVGSNGYTPAEIDAAGRWLALHGKQDRPDLSTCMLLHECEKFSDRIYSTPLHTYYSALNRCAVSTTTKIRLDAR